MVAFSLISYGKTRDISMMRNAMFFFVLLVIRVILFFWNLASEKKTSARRSQARMMLVTAVIIYLLRLFIAITVARNVFDGSRMLAIPDHTFMTVVYGLYTAGKIVLWIRSIKKRRRINLYLETLSCLGWYSALYSLAVFISYILYSGTEGKSSLPMMIIFWFTVISTIVIVVIMAVRSLGSLRKIRREKK